jgi:DNA-binding CsgD family transcriptional regulator
MTLAIEFVEEELVNREIEIASYLLQSFSLDKIAAETGLSKKHIAVHIRNMREKLGVGNVAVLKKIFKLK